MRIKKPSEPSPTTFGDLEPGDVFLDDGGDIAIKIEPRDADSTNAVVLESNGKPEAFGYEYEDDDEIQRVYEDAIINLDGE
jgi:hypothetical protein